MGIDFLRRITSIRIPSVFLMRMVQRCLEIFLTEPKSRHMIHFIEPPGESGLGPFKLRLKLHNLSPQCYLNSTWATQA